MISSITMLVVYSFTLVLPPPATHDTTTGPGPVSSATPVTTGTTTGPVSSATPVTTGTTQPSSGAVLCCFYLHNVSFTLSFSSQV